LLLIAHAPPFRRNNFGVLRILLALQVIVAHSPEVIDGNRSRELLTRVFGTLSLGEAAVDGFFLVSGYLITKSFVERPEALPYIIRRLARIVPGYLVSFWLCLLVLAPVAGADRRTFSLHGILHAIRSNLELREPDAAGIFHGLPIPALNGSMWTISYEFRCYLLVLVLAAIAALARLPVAKLRWAVLALTLAGLAVNAAGLVPWRTGPLTDITGMLIYDVRFFSVFGAGAAYYLFRDRIRYRDTWALAAGVVLAAAMFSNWTAEPAISLLGGYVIFWFALEAPALKLGAWAARNDLSYGIYLYAWPIQILLLWYWRSIGPWTMSLLTAAGASATGYVSWHAIEQPILDWAHRRTARVERPGTSDS
jgi:peptidoglycan/LPS O-acetylase OafA/YrhL